MPPKGSHRSRLHGNALSAAERAAPHGLPEPGFEPMVSLYNGIFCTLMFPYYTRTFTDMQEQGDTENP